jgi:hypothetical protein
MVAEEDVFYNWTNSNIMTLSRSGKRLHATKEMHPLTLEALIGTCSMPQSFVVDFTTSINM